MTWKMDSEIAGISALVAADAAAYMSAFCPSLFTIRAFRSTRNLTDHDETAGDIYRGMALGAALTLVTGFGGAAVTGSYWPLAISIVVLGVLIGAYVWALENPRGSAGIAEQG
jgi:hypothetical protein